MSHFTRHAALLFVLAVSLHVAAGAPLVSVPHYDHPGGGQVFYFVLTDRFANGDPSNDTGGLGGDREQNGFDPAAINYFHGGDFRGLTAKLDYIRDLGATAVWITPPFTNKAVQVGSAAYHGYWILDFMHIDPHLGTDADFREFVAQAHARGLKVYLDIVVNHTADVIQYRDGDAYIDRAHAPFRDASGAAFDDHALAYNGLNSPALFPKLSVEKSFPHVPYVAPGDEHAKNPEWLNDLTLYHNRGRTLWTGESSAYGDFATLDDLFTENPRVVRGFIDIYSHWIRDYGIDGYRIDTVKHVNVEFWQAFGPAVREAGRQAARPGFFMFGEVANPTGDAELMSEFATTGTLDASLDFGFYWAARGFISRGEDSSVMAGLFDKDDLYTGPDRNANLLPTFISNHDDGRLGFLLKRDNPGAGADLLLKMEELGYGLLYLSRGQPVLYYGDEQGMTGFGNDNASREDMFPSRSPQFRELALLGTTRTGADDKFDEDHPIYRLVRSLAALRAAHPALSRGSMVLRPCARPDVLAFSRVERGECVEYLVALNNSRTAPAEVVLQTSQEGGALFHRVFDSRDPSKPGVQDLTTCPKGRVTVKLDPLQFEVWRAAQRLPAPEQAPGIAIATPADGATLTFAVRDIVGHSFPIRQEIRAEVSGGDGVAEVTFAMTRASRPGQYELLGTDDAPPYRVYWRPPADLALGDILTFIATVDDLRGHRASADIRNVAVAPSRLEFGIRGAKVPLFTRMPPAQVALEAGNPLRLEASASGTEPVLYQWYRDGAAIAGATAPVLDVPKGGASLGGSYFLAARDREGTAITGETRVTVAKGSGFAAGRLVRHTGFESKLIPAREVDVWLPPGCGDVPGERYPVIYMQDGQNLFDPATSYGGVSWGVGSTLARLIAEHRVRPAIVVGVWNSGVARASEYVPQKAVRAKWIDEVHATFATQHLPIVSDAYLRFLVTELKPWVDATYPTKPGAGDTFIMGSSMGGLISAYALAEYPGVFGAAACLSTHWPAGDGAVVDYLAAHLPPPGSHRFYFDLGTETLDATYAPFQERMDNAMRAAGYTEGRDWVTRRFPGAEHSERSWSKRADQPLEFLLGK